MMMRLYCAEQNVFVDPTHRDVLVWYQQDRVDPTIGNLQTYLLYNAKRTLREKYWDEQKRKIRYRHKQSEVSGRYKLHVIPWSGLRDRDNRPVFHGDLLQEYEGSPPLVCDVSLGSIRLLLPHTGLYWSDVKLEQLKIIDSAILNPHVIGESIRDLFVYQTP